MVRAWLYHEALPRRVCLRLTAIRGAQYLSIENITRDGRFSVPVRRGVSVRRAVQLDSDDGFSGHVSELVVEEDFDFRVRTGSSIE